MSSDADRVEDRRDDDEHERPGDREPSTRGTRCPREHACGDDEWDEEDDLVIRPGVDRAGAREAEPRSERLVTARLEARGDPGTSEDENRRERTSHGPDHLVQRGLEHGRPDGPASGYVREPSAEPVPHLDERDDR